MHLNLTIITDGFDRDGGSDGAFRVPGPELHDVLGSAHQPSHGAAVLKKLLFFILNAKMQNGFLISVVLCTNRHTFSF